MKDFSIEYSSQKINSEKTKEYFKEVSSSYYNTNYRAAIVTLYSVVINDILVKLEVLDEIYSDSVAKSILDEIKTFQKANPTNSDWEKDIVEKVKTRTNLFDNVDYAHILALKNDRHLCAHPVIDKEDKLYTPNKETVASHIRNMMESLFLKPPVLSKKILSTILLDIADKKDLLIDEISLEKYLKSKYLENLNPTIELSIFRDLWKFIFRLEDAQSKENRLINYRVLYFLFKRNLESCIKKIKSEQEYFSNILNSAETIHFLIRFLSENDFLYMDFRDDVHLLIKKQIETNLSARTVAWFITGDYLEHLDKIKNLISNDFNSTYPYDADMTAYQRLLKIGFTRGFINEVVDFVIWRYSKAKNYNDADKVFTYILLPNLNYFSTEKLTELCEESNKNGQVCSRKQSEDEHKNLKRHIESKINDFDFKKYTKMF